VHPFQETHARVDDGRDEEAEQEQDDGALDLDDEPGEGDDADGSQGGAGDAPAKCMNLLGLAGMTGPNGWTKVWSPGRLSSGM
jgi:hypothetical protein